MAFLNTENYDHRKTTKIGVLLVNLGTPDAPTTGAVRKYLAQFLSDPRVVEIPRLIWFLILHGIILRIRPARSAKKYASVWTDQGSPLAIHTQAQAQLLQARLQDWGGDLLVRSAMTYGQPSLKVAVQQLAQLENVDRLLLIPLYPQFSATTTASVWDAVFKVFQQLRNPPALRLVKHYHDDPAYINALAQRVQAHWALHPWQAGDAKMIVMTFHGLPKRNLLLGDPYFCECHKTARLLAQSLGLAADQYKVTFQSRFGKATWLQPYTEPTLQTLAHTHQRVDVICPGFTGDCLETLEEIAIEARHTFLQNGGQTFHYIEALNESTPWIDALEALARSNLQGWEHALQQEGRLNLALEQHHKAQKLGQGL